MSFTIISSRVLAGAIAVVGLSSIGVFAATSPTIQQDVQNVKTALINKDFNAFKSAQIQLATDKVNSLTQDEFNKQADMAAKMQKYDTALDEAVKNNDFNAFKTVEAQIKADREANKPADAPADSNRPNRPEPTEAQLQERFNKMVTKYKADGTLPSTNKLAGMGEGMMGGKGDRGMKGGPRGDRDGDNNNSNANSSTSTTTVTAN